MGWSASHTTPSRSRIHATRASWHAGGDRPTIASVGAAGPVCYNGSVPHFEPFPGIRYRADQVDLADVTAPPYDVISPSDRAVLAARHDHNVVAIDLPVDGDDPYEQAALTYDHWQDEGVLVRDEPSFYVYRMDFRDEAGDARRTTGVLGALELSRPGEGGILPHEHTTPKAAATASTSCGPPGPTCPPSGACRRRPGSRPC
jgi:hypothetical protein